MPLLQSRRAVDVVVVVIWESGRHRRLRFCSIQHERTVAVAVAVEMGERSQSSPPL